MKRLGASAGDGLGASARLLREVMGPILELADTLEDGYRLPNRLASQVITSDVYSVDPLEFPGGDIGSLAACGAINDLACSGAQINECSLGVYASADLEVERFTRVLRSFSRMVGAQGGRIVCGDTKVHTERHPELILFVTAIGDAFTEHTLDLADTRSGDDLIVTGPLGNHTLAVLSAREGLGFESVIRSDAQPLVNPIKALARRGILHSARDLTRGGLVAALWDLFEATGLSPAITESSLPIDKHSRAAAEMLGLDVLSLTNEGCLLVTSSAEDRGLVLQSLQTMDETANARVVGTAERKGGHGPVLATDADGRRLLPLPSGLGIPRLC